MDAGAKLPPRTPEASPPGPGGRTHLAPQAMRKCRSKSLYLMKCPSCAGLGMLFRPALAATSAGSFLKGWNHPFGRQALRLWERAIRGRSRCDLGRITGREGCIQGLCSRTQDRSGSRRIGECTRIVCRGVELSRVQRRPIGDRRRSRLGDRGRRLARRGR